VAEGYSIPSDAETQENINNAAYFSMLMGRI